MSNGIPKMPTTENFTVDVDFYAVSLTIQILLFLASLALFLHSLLRSCVGIRDPEYIEDRQYQTMAKHARVIDHDGSQNSEEPDQDDETQENLRKQMAFIKIERRILSALPCFIGAIVCINSFASRGETLALFLLAIVLFIIFNLTWVPSVWGKLLFMLPLMAIFIIFFTGKHKFGAYN